MSEVAKDYSVARGTVHAILAQHRPGAGRAAPTTMIGIDETRARSAGWSFNATSWRRRDRG